LVSDAMPQPSRDSGGQPSENSSQPHARAATAEGELDAKRELTGKVAATLLVVAAVWTALSWASTAFAQPPGAMLPGGSGGEGMQPVDLKAQLEPLKQDDLEFSPDQIDPKWRDQFLIVNELIRADDYTVFNKTENGKFRQALKSDNLTPAERDLLAKGARIRTLRLSLEENRRSLRDCVDEIVKDMELYGTGAPAREYALQEFTKNAKLLLDNQIHVRIAAAILLRSLNGEKANPIRRTPARPYVGALDIMLEILSNPNQHEAVKIQAVKGVERICLDGDPKVDIRMKIAETLAQQLKEPKTNPWYQMVIARALGACNISVNLQQQPFVAQVLLESMNDRSRHPMVRCEAARSLGRVPFDNPSINMALVTYELAELTYEMGSVYNRYPTLSYWSTCFWNLYLGFHPESNSEEAKGAGLLELVKKSTFRASATLVTDAYQNAVKVVNGVLVEPVVGNRKPMDNNKLQPLAQWLQANKPASDVLQPGMPSINPPAAPPATTNDQASATR
jgi:hypothetical protein